VALAVGIIRLASHQTLVKDLYSIEMLARSDVLCLDKTGTITDGTMRLKDIQIQAPHNSQAVQQALRSLLLAQPQQNDTAEAVLEALASWTDAPWPATQVVPFSSERKRSAASFDQRGTDIMGASEFVFQTLPPKQQVELDQWTKEGYRVLVVGHTEDPILNHEIPPAQTLLAIVIIEDHIREDAPAILEWFQTNGVDIKIISGDHPQAVASIAARANVPHADSFVNLEGKTLQEVDDLAHQYTIFGRVTPEQKKQLIQSYRKQGHTVAMTGDGVNDILAFKEADCSIAMASGSEAARGVANLVLLDSNFSSLPKVVYEGRRVVNNIEKSSTLFLMKTIFTILLSLLVMILQIPYPITPSNLILFEFCVIGVPSVLLVIQPNTAVIRGHFLQTVFRKALPYALTFLLNAILVIVLSRMLGLTLYRDDIVIYTMTYIGFIALCFLSWPLNRFRRWMLVGSFLIISLGFWILPHVSLGGDPILEFLPLEMAVVWLTIGLIASSIPCLIVLKKIVEHWFPQS
jgi:cation-transporting ATPase E